jgi:hypothetical protein
MAGLKLMAELGLDGAGFAQGLQRAEGAAKGFAQGLKGFVIGAIGITTVEQAISKTVQTAKELINTSERLAIAPERLQVLRQAAKESGTELEHLATVFERIDIARQKALTPGEHGAGARSAFGALGVTMPMLHEQTAAQLFMGQMRNAVMSQNPEVLSGVLRELFGKGFGPAIAVLKTDFDKLGAKMQKMGAIMDTETALSFKLVSDELSTLSQIIVSNLGPALLWLAEHFYKVAGKITSYFVGEKGAQSKMTGREKIGYSVGRAIAGLTGAASLPFGRAYAAKAAESMLYWLIPERVIDKYDAKAGQQARDKEQTKWDSALKNLKEQIAKEKERLEHPAPPNFENPEEPPKFKRRDIEGRSDQLVRIGNFLGGIGIVGSIEARKVELLQVIASNTSGLRGLGGFMARNPVTGHWYDVGPRGSPAPRGDMSGAPAFCEH